VEEYEVDILDGSDNVVRTITKTASPINGSIVNASTQSATYEAGDQVADFTVVQSSIKIRVYQIGQSVGRSKKVEVTL
jgi:hypothetical protein